MQRLTAITQSGYDKGVTQFGGELDQKEGLHFLITKILARIGLRT